MNITIRTMRLVPLIVAALALAAFDGSALAQPKEKGGGKDKQEQRADKGSPQGGKEKGAKKQKHHNGKDLLGAKIKQNGKHELHKNGKHTAYVDVQDGKIRGVSVKHSEKGDVPVKKYKTKQKMAEATPGLMPANLILAQAEYMGTTYIGYSYIDDYGDEVIYWFPYDMIYDGDTGAVDYVPAY